MPAVFTYGTLAIPSVMEAVTGHRFRSRETELDGFVRLRLRGRIYPAAIERPGSRIAGRVYEDVDPATLARLDRFEGRSYERREAPVLLPGGGEVPANLYVLAPAGHGELLEEPWDPAEFARVHLAAYLRSCAAFRAREEARSAAPARR
jgi:gamma-glutamylcyclotransferase (GGCT)/AIG2-like uncharacterized protein YtfP